MAAAAVVCISDREALTAAKGNCAYCHGFGRRQTRYWKMVICNCVFRAMFRECMDHYRVSQANTNQTGSVQLLFSPAKVSALTYCNKNAEYLADIEIRAKRVLDAVELRCFTLHFLGGLDWRGCTVLMRMSRGNFFHAIYRIEQKLGKSFGECGIWPTQKYFNGRYMDQNNMARSALRRTN